MASEWYFQVMGEMVGPVSAAELKAQAENGTIGPDTLIRRSAEGKWVSASQVQGLVLQAPDARTVQNASPAMISATSKADGARSAHGPPPVPGPSPPAPSQQPVESSRSQANGWWSRAILGYLVRNAIAIVALAVGISCLLYIRLRDPLEGGLEKYDFSTPKAALLSQMRMLADNDYRAHLAFDRIVHAAESKERADSIAVHREIDWRGKKVLFTS